MDSDHDDEYETSVNSDYNSLVEHVQNQVDRYQQIKKPVERVTFEACHPWWRGVLEKWILFFSILLLIDGIGGVVYTCVQSELQPIILAGDLLEIVTICYWCVMNHFNVTPSRKRVLLSFLVALCAKLIGNVIENGMQWKTYVALSLFVVYVVTLVCTMIIC